MNRKVIKRAVAGDFRRKGLLRGITDWNLNERGQAVRDYLKGEKL